MALRMTGLREAYDEHAELAERARDLTPLLEELRLELQAMIDTAWSQRRSPGGDPWPDTERESESSGELQRAVRVRVQGDRLVIEVGASHASFVFFGTEHQPARNPLPVEWVGGQLVWMSRGAAGEWLESMVARLHAYLTLGDARAA